MFTKLVAYLGDYVMLLCIEGYTSIVVFRRFIRNIVKISKVNTVDEEKSRWASPYSIQQQNV